jgi:hypothetical protein
VLIRAITPCSQLWLAPSPIERQPPVNPKRCTLIQVENFSVDLFREIARNLEVMKMRLFDVFMLVFIGMVIVAGFFGPYVISIVLVAACIGCWFWRGKSHSDPIS